MTLRVLLAVILFVLAPLGAKAAERITDFDVGIEVEKDGDILVTENISVIAEGRSIRRGIYRDLPRFYLKGAQKLPYRYDVKSVSRDGKREHYVVQREGNAFRIRIGDADVLLSNGPHVYAITYEVKNQIRYFDDYDEIYWNVTGDYWAFPIDRAQARIALPGGAGARRYAAYTGRHGESDRNYVYRFENGAHVFTTTAPLGVREGLTVAVGFAKGIVDPPSGADARADWWAVNASYLILAIAFVLIGFYYLFTFEKVGRDPPKGPIFPRYEPPEGYSPAAVHMIYHRGLSGHDAFIAALMNLAMKKRIKIDASDKKKTTLVRLDGESAGALSRNEQYLLDGLLGSLRELTFGGKYNSRLSSAYQSFQSKIRKDFGARFFRWNWGFLLFALILSIAAIALAVSTSLEWTTAHTIAAGALLSLSAVASYFLPAPTRLGQEVRTEIEGFRLYLKTAEEIYLNAVEVGSGAPPPMTVERYEKFLPYAIALGVEKPWSEHFEKLMPEEAAAYTPVWASSGYRGRSSLASLNSALVAGISSGVSSSLPQSSSSSGSGGGGFSGGGGGGGGGGGW